MVKRLIEEIAPETVTQLSMPQERGPETYAMVPESHPEKLESANAGPMACKTYCIKVHSERAPEFMDITSHVRECVADSGVRSGFVVVYSKHTTAAVKINENEPLLLQDMEDFLERISPRNAYYRHNDFEIRTANMTDNEAPNGHAHCQHLLMGGSETIPIANGGIVFGPWQSIFMVELDHPRPREVVVQVIGQ